MAAPVCGTSWPSQPLCDCVTWAYALQELLTLGFAVLAVLWAPLALGLHVEHTCVHVHGTLPLGWALGACLHVLAQLVEDQLQETDSKTNSDQFF